MENLQPKHVFEFLKYIHRLKHTPRRGWQKCLIRDHETVSDHMYSMAMMTFLLANNTQDDDTVENGTDNTKLDRFKCMQLALVHDLAESITGDIIPADNIPVERKHHMEDVAMQEITGTLKGHPIGTFIYHLYKEYEAKETAEAKFVKDLDRFDLLFTAQQYEERDGTPGSLEEFFTNSRDQFQHPFMRKLMQHLDETRKTNNKDTKITSTL